MPDDDFEDLDQAPSDVTNSDSLAFFHGMIDALAEANLVPDARELALITAIARQIQHVAGISAALAETGPLTVGSKGQPVASPLLQAHNNAVNALSAMLFKAKGIAPNAATAPALAGPGSRALRAA